MSFSNLKNKHLFSILGLILSFSMGPISHGTEGNRRGNEGSGGGNVLVCEKNPAHPELFDYWEARSINGMTIDLGGPELSVKEKVNLALQRIEPKSKILFEDLSALAAEFFTSTAWVPGTAVTQIDDSNQLAVPKDCLMNQIARQKNREFAGEKIYVIDADLWKLLDSNNQAGLVLHEILYYYARARGATTSSAVRYFNGLLSTQDAFSKMTLEQFVQVARSGIHANVVTFLGLNLESIEFDDNGNFQKAYLNQSRPGSIRIENVLVLGNLSDETRTHIHFSNFGQTIHFENNVLTNSSQEQVKVKLADSNGSFFASIDVTKALTINREGKVTKGFFLKSLKRGLFEFLSFDEASAEFSQHGYKTFFCGQLIAPKKSFSLTNVRESNSSLTRTKYYLNNPVYCQFTTEYHGIGFLRSREEVHREGISMQASISGCGEGGLITDKLEVLEISLSGPEYYASVYSSKSEAKKYHGYYLCK